MKNNITVKIQNAPEYVHVTELYVKHLLSFQ